MQVVSICLDFPFFSFFLKLVCSLEVHNLSVVVFCSFFRLFRMLISAKMERRDSESRGFFSKVLAVEQSKLGKAAVGWPFRIAWIKLDHVGSPSCWLTCNPGNFF